jgi:Protein of unknown function (DUF3421)
MILALLASSSLPAQADDRCKQGYVWREAFSGDHVCVTPQARQQAADDNSQAASRNDPQRPGFCLQGYVWREANANDHVCMAPATRAQAQADNGAAANRTVGQTGPGNFQPDPGLHRKGSGATGGPDVTIEWKSASNGSVPPGAVLGGWEKYGSQPGSSEIQTDGPLYVCRAGFDGAVYIGKVVKNNCNFSAAGNEHQARSYEVMTSRSANDSLGWQRSGSTPPPGALVGGHWPDGQLLYICRISYDGGIHPGWRMPVHGLCSIGYGGDEIQRPGMSYLVPQKGKPIDSP